MDKNSLQQEFMFCDRFQFLLPALVLRKKGLSSTATEISSLETHIFPKSLNPDLSF